MARNRNRYVRRQKLTAPVDAHLHVGDITRWAAAVVRSGLAEEMAFQIKAEPYSWPLKAVQLSALKALGID